MAKPTLKTLTFSGFEIKDEDKGEVTASIATLGVVDHDGDIIRKGAMPKGAKAVMSRWGHDSVWGERPVGKGPLTEESGHLVFNGRVFLNTGEGRETFEVLKEMGQDQEWSFGFRVTGWEAPSEDERKQGAVRIITKMAPISDKLFEVSPVLAGAGIGTHTARVKSVTPAPQADGDGTVTIELTGTPATVDNVKALAAAFERDLMARLPSPPDRDTSPAEPADPAPAPTPADDAAVAQVAADQKARELAAVQEQAEAETRRATAEAAESQRVADEKARAVAAAQAKAYATTAALHDAFLATVRAVAPSPELEFERFQRTMRSVE